MEKLKTMMQGHKTKLVAAGVGLVVALAYGGVIDSTMANTLLGFLGAGGMLTIGAKVDRQMPALEAAKPAAAKKT